MELMVARLPIRWPMARCALEIVDVRRTMVLERGGGSVAPLDALYACQCTNLDISFSGQILWFGVALRALKCQFPG